MPCRSDYLAEPKVVYKEVYITEPEYKAKVDGEAKAKIAKLNSQLQELTTKYNKMVDERNKIVKELDEMTWAFCFVTNRLFENDIGYLKILLSNQRVASQFWEHQQSDMKSGRPFIYKDRDGELQRFTPNYLA